MMPRDYVDRALVDWIAGQSRSRATYLDDVLAVTARTPQRPAWSFPGRWLPMQLAMQRVVVPRGARYVLLLALLLLAFAVAAVALVGSQRRVPAPLGPAANGVVAYATTTGDIATVDPVSGAVTTLVAAPERDIAPVFSRDGTRVAFTRIRDGGRLLLAVDARGGQPMQLTPRSFPEITEASWAPDGRRIAFVSEGRLWLVSSDGAGTLTELPLGPDLVAHDVTWRPPEGAELVFRGGTSAGYGLFAVGTDGSKPTAISRVIDEQNAYILPAFTPSGDRLVTQTDKSVVVLAIDRTTGRVVGEEPVDSVWPGRISFAPTLSPDGTRMAMVVEPEPGAGIWLGLASLDNPRQVTLTKLRVLTLDCDAQWAPDGSAVLVRFATGAWLVDAAAGTARQTDWRVADLDWQRVAP